MSSNTAYSELIHFNDTDSLLNISQQSLYFIDETATLGISDILRPENQQKFRSTNKDTVHFGFSSASIWVKISYQDLREEKYIKDLVLGLENPTIENVEIFRPKAGRYESRISGLLHDYNKREINNKNFLFFLPDAVNEPVTIYLKINSRTALSLPTSLISIHKKLIGRTLKASSSEVFFYIFILILFYNILLSFSLREKMLYHYVIWFTTLSTLLSFLAGTIQPLAGWVSNALANHLPLVLILFSASYLQFISSFLDISNRHPKQSKFNTGLIIFYLANALLVIMANYWLILWSFFLVCLSFAVVQVYLIRDMLLKHNIAYMGLLAFTPISISGTIYMLESTGYAPTNWWTLNSLFLSLIFTGVIMALTMGNKVRCEKEDNLLLRKTNQEALEENYKLLKRSNKIKDTFISTISHELRTPINGMSGSIALLEDSVNTMADQSQLEVSLDVNEYFDAVNKSSEEMLRLVNNIIAFTELQSKRTQLNQRYFSLQECLNTAIKQREKEITRKNLTTVIETGSLNNLEICSDEEKHGIALGLILDNAIKFTNSGTLTISTSVEQQTDKQSKLNITISDTGIGMPASKIKQVMEPFRQIDQSASRAHGGLGIGLALCTKVLELLKGEMAIESTEGQGTQVKLTYITTDVRVITPVEDTEKEAVISKINQVLIAEDNLTNQLVIKRMVEKMGLDPIVAENGSIALEVVRNQKIDLVLMDCQMPVMDGFEATRQIRNLSGKEAALPIISVTANTSDEDRRRCKECGMDDFLAKPVTYKTLASTIAKWR
ncbi:MAG: response regulator [Pseudomonadales bacterium]|nr:response regulator [Pseudomonadales bacterium]